MNGVFCCTNKIEITEKHQFNPKRNVFESGSTINTFVYTVIF